MSQAPGNPENAHTIEVSLSALPAHLAHGDSLGACSPTLTPEATPEPTPTPSPTPEATPEAYTYSNS